MLRITALFSLLLLAHPAQAALTEGCRRVKDSPYGDVEMRTTDKIQALAWRNPKESIVSMGHTDLFTGKLHWDYRLRGMSTRTFEFIAGQVLLMFDENPTLGEQCN